MGLGKTIEALALILARPSRNHNRKTTLIVAPLALLRQWKREIETKLKPQHPLTAIIFHGPGKYMKIDDLLQHDVVLCTYGKLAAEYKTAFEQKRPDRLTILHKKAKFHRVILDEAHYIKNKSAKASLAAAEIQATYRLCMTGTPFMNRAGELFPLIRFLRIEPYSKWETFSEEIDRPIQRWNGDMADVAMRKLQTVFRSLTIRRTKDSILDSKPILTLPPRREVDAHTVFDEEQLAFYRALELQQRLRFNKFLKAGTVMQNYLYILVLLLRLRQACDHPHLIKDHGVPDGTQLSPNKMLELAFQLDPEVVERLRKPAEFKCPICPGDDAVENPVIISPCGHFICAQCFNTSMIVRQTEGDGDECGSIICPADGCETEILPTNVLMYNFFVDAHMAGSDGDCLADDERFGNDSGYAFEYGDDPPGFANFLQDNADGDIDLGGFIVVEDHNEEDHRDVADSDFPSDEGMGDARAHFLSEDELDECDPDSDSVASDPWVGSYGGLFVTQSPESYPADEARSPDLEELSETNQIAKVDGEVNRGVQHGDHATARPATTERLATPSPKLERSISPSFQASGSRSLLLQNGTADNPITLDDSDEEMVENDDMDIQTYDGPSSPRVGETSFKREASPGQSVSGSKKSRPQDYASSSQSAFIDLTLDDSEDDLPNQHPRQTTPSPEYGQYDQIELDDEGNPKYQSDEYYEGEDSPAQQFNHMDDAPGDQNASDIPMPSVECAHSVADARSRKQKTGAFISLGNLRYDATKSAGAMHRYRQRLRKEWVPSAKTDKIMELLRAIQARQPGEKTLVFSLWTSFLDMLEVPLQDEAGGGLAFTRYDGGMRPDHRDAAVRSFMENADVRVMLVSLTAGNAGLNLTAASQVIICEPFWNPFTEDQAIDRAHRIGQTKEVTVYRVLVAGTVEDRIQDLQAKKRALVNAAMSEEGASAAGRLTVEQLQGLFGA